MIGLLEKKTIMIKWVARVCKCFGSFRPSDESFFLCSFVLKLYVRRRCHEAEKHLLVLAVFGFVGPQAEPALFLLCRLKPVYVEQDLRESMKRDAVKRLEN